jgi:hypothetical protein
MKRESFPLPIRPQVSDRSSGYFFQLVELIGRHHEPTKTQLEALESSYQSTGEFLAECDEFEGLLGEIYPHGSRQLGTLTRPLDDSREGFDIDLIAGLDRAAMKRYGDDGGPARLHAHLYAALDRYAKQHGLGIKRWERCVTLEYANGMTADIAPVIDSPLLSVPYGQTHGRVPDRKLQTYNATNPRGYAGHFNDIAKIAPVFPIEETVVFAQDSVRKAEIAPLSDANQVFARLLCRLVQLIKLHRNVAFGKVTGGADLSPTSIFITTLIAAAYAVEAPKLHASPLSLLFDIVETMPLYFTSTSSFSSDEWYLPNPSAPGDNLASAMNTTDRQEAFYLWHQRLVTDLEQILQAIESRSGRDEIFRMVDVAFGKRAANAIQQGQLQQQNAARAAGIVTIITPAATPRIISSRSHSFFGR